MDNLKDKTYLKALLTLLKISKAKIRKDECGDYIVPGVNGKIFTVAPYWYIYYDAKTPRYWNSVKSKLSFLEVQNDGDWEGIFRGDFPPSEDQAKTIRKILKIRISTQLTEDERALLKNRLKSPSQKGVLESPVRLNEEEVDR